jgi:hypothetical protein
MILLSVFWLTSPATSFAWRDYTYHDWDWYGSGRDYPYSYYIDTYYSPHYEASPLFFDDITYINNISAPAIVPLPAQPVSQLPLLPSFQPAEFIVNIPNDKGGYTPVIIKRSGNGYIGPQGEYYPEFPKVSQLKLLYGK